MAASRPLIAVLSASSNTGGACVKALVERHGAAVRAVFRTEARAELFTPQWSPTPDASLEVATGFDAYDGVESLVPAFDGADVAVVVTPHAGPAQFKDDAMLAERMIEAASHAGVRHIINIGSWTVNAAEPLAMLSSRFTGPEAALQELQPPTSAPASAAAAASWTNIRAGYFHQNLVAMFGAAVRAGGDTLPFPEQCAFAPVDPRDVGKVAAAVAAVGGQGHASASYEVSGPELLSAAEMAGAFGAALGRPELALGHVSAAEIGGAALPPALRQLLLFLEDRGSAAVPFTDEVMQLTGERATSLTQWLNEHRALLE